MLFEPITIDGIDIQNRFVRSSTHEWLAEDDGTPTQKISDLYEELAKGEVGLILTGYAYVNPKGKSGQKQQGMYDDRFIEPYRQIVDRVHKYDTKIVAQIVHGGRQVKPTPEYPVSIAPSAVTDTSSGNTPKEMSEEEILGTIEDFANAARRVKEAGFDGVQIHCAHGFLLSSFISSYTNRRTDKWGGSTENRTRIITEIIKRIREMIGEEFPILVKMNSIDGFPPESGKEGIGLPECVEIAKILERNGVCAIEVSGGIFEAGEVMSKPDIDDKENEAYFKEYSIKIKEAVDIPVILVGGIRSRDVMEKLLEEDYADMISMSRPFIREPDLVVKFSKGETDSVACISCNKCFDPSGVKCIFNR